MILKLHQPSEYQSYLLHLQDRYLLESYDQRKFYSYYQGYIGEFAFYQKVSALDGVLVIWDVSLETAGRNQFDFLVILHDRIFHFDIKNFTGLYTYDKGIFKSEKGYVNRDVMKQLRDAHHNMETFLLSNGYSFKMHSKIVLINDELDLHGYDGDEHIILPNQVDQVIDYLKKFKSVTKEMQKVGKHLIKLHKLSNDYDRIYYYPFELIKPGLRCPKCRKIGMQVNPIKQYMNCSCGYKVSNQEAVRIAFDEIEILKNGNVMMKDLVNWTGLSKSTILRGLRVFADKRNKSKATYYVKR